MKDCTLIIVILAQSHYEGHYCLYSDTRATTFIIDWIVFKVILAFSCLERLYYLYSYTRLRPSWITVLCVKSYSPTAIIKECTVFVVIVASTVMKDCTVIKVILAQCNQEGQYCLYSHSRLQQSWWTVLYLLSYSQQPSLRTVLSL